MHLYRNKMTVATSLLYKMEYAFSWMTETSIKRSLHYFHFYFNNQFISVLQHLISPASTPKSWNLPPMEHHLPEPRHLQTMYSPITTAILLQYMQHLRITHKWLPYPQTVKTYLSKSYGQIWEAKLLLFITLCLSASVSSTPRPQFQRVKSQHARSAEE